MDLCCSRPGHPFLLISAVAAAAGYVPGSPGATITAAAGNPVPHRHDETVGGNPVIRHEAAAITATQTAAMASAVAVAAMGSIVAIAIAVAMASDAAAADAVPAIPGE